MEAVSPFNPTTWTDSERDKMPFFEYRLQDAVHGRSMEKFPLLAPFAYQQYQGRREIYLYIFDAAGSIIKHGICSLNEVINPSAGSKARPLDEVLEIDLYSSFRAYNERIR